MPTWTKRALEGALALIATLALALGALWLHLGQGVGRVAVGELVTGWVSQKIPGTFTLTEVREARLPAVRVGTLRMEAPNGRTVLELHDVDAELDLGRSWSQRMLIARRATVGSGRVDVSEAADGRSYLEHAVSDGEPEPPSSSSSGGGFGFRFEEVDFEGLNTRIAREGGPTLRLLSARGRARLWLPKDADVQLRFWGVHGHLEMEGIPIVSETPIDGLALTIDPSAAPTVRFATGARLTGSEVTVAGGLGGRNHQPRLCLWTGGPSLATLLGLGAEVVVPLVSSLDLDVRPSEAPRRPRCEEGA